VPDIPVFDVVDELRKISWSGIPVRFRPITWKLLSVSQCMILCMKYEQLKLLVMYCLSVSLRLSGLSMCVCVCLSSFLRSQFWIEFDQTCTVVCGRKTKIEFVGGQKVVDNIAVGSSEWHYCCWGCEIHATLLYMHAILILIYVTPFCLVLLWKMSYNLKHLRTFLCAHHYIRSRCSIFINSCSVW